MKTRFLVVLLAVFVFSCKNSSEKNTATDEMVSENTIGKEDDATSEENVFDDNDEMDEGLSMQYQITSEAVKKMVQEGNMTPTQADEILANFKDQLGAGDDLENIDLSNVEANLSNFMSELENAMEAAGDSTGTSKPVLTSTPFRSERERALDNLREMLDTPNAQYIEEVIFGWWGFGREKRNLVHRKLASETIDRSKADAALLEFFEISEKELNMLKQLPASEKIISESRVIATRDYKLPEEIQTHLDSGNASESFKTTIGRFDYNRGSTSRKFLPKAKKAREEFYNLNPAWYGSKDEGGDTYVDSHHNYIHLPLGDLSFADKLISHEMEIANGGNSEGAVGIPDMALDKFTTGGPKVCNLGTRGVLVLEFTDNAITNVNGPDLFIFEMGAIEPTNLEISKDGETWIDVGKIKGGTAEVDIAEFVRPKETFTYIRLTDLVTSSTLPGADVDAVAAIGGALRLNLDSAVLFDTGKYELKESATEALVKLVADIGEIPQGTIIVEGHTDNVGDPKSNKTLSENRARVVSDYLKKHLKGAYSFQQKGFGESQPVAANDSDENKQRNRRVEILVIPSK